VRSFVRLRFAFSFEEKKEKKRTKSWQKKKGRNRLSLSLSSFIDIMSGGENNNKQMTTRERQQIEVAKLEAELNALKVDAAKVRTR